MALAGSLRLPCCLSLRISTQGHAWLRLGRCSTLFSSCLGASLALRIRLRLALTARALLHESLATGSTVPTPQGGSRLDADVQVYLYVSAQGLAWLCLSCLALAYSCLGASLALGDGLRLALTARAFLHKSLAAGSAVPAQQGGCGLDAGALAHIGQDACRLQALLLQHP